MVDDIPSTVEAFQQRWQQAQREQSQQAAQETTLGMLGDMVNELLDRNADVWDQPSMLLGMLTVDQLQVEHGMSVQQAAELLDMPAERIAAASSSAGPDRTRVGRVLEVLEIVEGNPYDCLEQYILDDKYSAAIFVSEGWASGTFADVPVPDDVPRDSRGRHEVRMVTAVLRTGGQIMGIQDRGGGRIFDVEEPATAVEKIKPSEDGRKRFGAGRIVDAVRRTMQLPTRPLSETPWTAMLDVWADTVRQQLEGEDELDDDTALLLLQGRPDWLFFATQGALLGVDMVGSNIDAEEVAAGHTDALGKMVRRWAEQAGVDRVGAAASEFSRQLWRILPEAGWLPAVWFDAALDLLRPQQDRSTPEMRQWMGPQWVFNERILPLQRPGAAAELARDKRLPKWFRREVERTDVAATRLRLPPAT